MDIGHIFDCSAAIFRLCKCHVMTSSFVINSLLIDFFLVALIWPLSFNLLICEIVFSLKVVNLKIWSFCFLLMGLYRTFFYCNMNFEGINFENRYFLFCIWWRKKQGKCKILKHLEFCGCLIFPISMNRKRIKTC